MFIVIHKMLGISTDVSLTFSVCRRRVKFAEESHTDQERAHSSQRTQTGSRPKAIL